MTGKPPVGKPYKVREEKVRAQRFQFLRVVGSGRKETDWNFCCTCGMKVIG